MVECGLLALANAHFEVDGIAHDVYLDGVEAVEHVAVVIVEVAHGVVVARKAFLHERLVVDIALVEL